MRTFRPLYSYFRPLDYYNSKGYYSDVYLKSYYDGYGYNFYYGTYGYYEYTVNQTEEEKKASLVIMIVGLSLCVCVTIGGIV
eukprot:CAMPEP_0168617910 /NCGR_PEP_ID=MMETSP0449_2-20121227/5792_1 /TAXON_ID=1082188 /ORGANISM="Strombidium rassoulzadegani, Strain ras09" /LENGTH=81 /DNA_ID=CAMNT_0008658753 /DNA_START=442 /DNA_END=684 /DNA_ORIENTATION=+